MFAIHRQMLNVCFVSMNGYVTFLGQTSLSGMKIRKNADVSSLFVKVRYVLDTLVLLNEKD